MSALLLFSGVFSRRPRGFGFLVNPDTQEKMYVRESLAKRLFPGDYVTGYGALNQEQSPSLLEVVDVEPGSRKVLGFAARAQLVPLDSSYPTLPLPFKVPDGTLVGATAVWTGHEFQARPELQLNANDPFLWVQATAWEYDIPVSPQLTVPDVEQPKHNIDLSDLPFVTVDGPSTRDIDDAICAEQHSNGWMLHVAIADAAHYVPSGSALDLHARHMGGTAYFPGKTVHMLPASLSEDSCSLREGAVRSALVASIHIASNGVVGELTVRQAWIKSKARLTYRQVQDFYSGVFSHTMPSVLANLRLLTQVAEVLQVGRAPNIGEFPPETRLEVEQTSGKMTGFHQEDSSSSAHKLVEACMVAVNSAIARKLATEVQGLFRNQELSDDQIQMLQQFLEEHQISYEGTLTSRSDLIQLRDTVRGTSNDRFVKALYRKVLPAAAYQPQNLGHTGLGAAAYTHFTSPIRRYPDVVVHRLLKGENIQNLDGLIQETNQQNRRIRKAVRVAEQRLITEFLADQPPQEWQATLTGIRDNGLFFEVPGTPYSGFIPSMSIPSGSFLDNSRQELIVDGGAYRLGDEIAVRFQRVRPATARAEFAVVEAGPRVTQGPSSS